MESMIKTGNRRKEDFITGEEPCYAQSYFPSSLVFLIPANSTELESKDLSAFLAKSRMDAMTLLVGSRALTVLQSFIEVDNFRVVKFQGMRLFLESYTLSTPQFSAPNCKKENKVRVLVNHPELQSASNDLPINSRPSRMGYENSCSFGLGMIPVRNAGGGRICD